MGGRGGFVGVPRGICYGVKMEKIKEMGKREIETTMREGKGIFVCPFSYHKKIKRE